MTDSTPREPTPEPTPDQFRPEGVSNWYEDYPFGAVPPGPVPPGGGGAPGAVPGALPPGGAPGVRVRRRGHVRPTVAAVLAAGTLAASAAATHALWPSGGTRAATSSSTLPSGSASGPGSGAPASSTEGDGAPTDVSSISAKVDPAVVDINATFGYQGARGAGTGIVLTSDGEILTNNHVIDGATSISVTDVGNGRTYTAKIVGYDATVDVAVLQLAGASGLETASIGDSSAVKVGQAVVAIGNAGGTGGTPTAAGGSVTALNQTITASDALDGTSESLSNLIETNANVQSGDSGGPLVDTAGRVIGMDTAASQGYSLQSAYGAARQGYAIPINQALSIARQIESGQASSTVHIGGTAFLGVLISSSSSQSPGSFSYGGYGDYYGGSTEPGGGSGSASGAVVGGVVSGGPAAQAGLSRGDVITSLDGHAVTTSRSLTSTIAGDRPGQRVELSWTDTSGVSHTATVTLQSGPPA